LDESSATADSRSQDEKQKKKKKQGHNGRQIIVTHNEVEQCNLAVNADVLILRQ
jgi:uncharacterized protein YheU (UPF0270 family)